MDWGPLHFFSLFWWSFCYPKLVPVTLCSCVNRSTFWVGPDDQLFIPDVCFWSEGALDLMDDGDFFPVVRCEGWRNDILTWLLHFTQVLRFLHWFHLLGSQFLSQEISKMTLWLCRKGRGSFIIKIHRLNKLLLCIDKLINYKIFKLLKHFWRQMP